MVEARTLDCGSGLDLRTVRSSPGWGVGGSTLGMKPAQDSLPPSLPLCSCSLTHTLSLSLKKKEHSRIFVKNDT